MSEIVLVGGPKDGAVTEKVDGLQSINNIKLNEDHTAPESVSLYLPTGQTDKEGREIFVHIGQYDAEESKSYWDSLSAAEKQQFIDAAEEEEAEEDESTDDVVEESESTDEPVEDESETETVEDTSDEEAETPADDAETTEDEESAPEADEETVEEVTPETAEETSDESGDEE